MLLCVERPGPRRVRFPHPAVEDGEGLLALLTEDLDCDPIERVV
jgi:hypothetical protein